MNEIKPVKSAKNPDVLIIGNEVRNIRKETELEPPQTLSTIKDNNETQKETEKMEIDKQKNDNLIVKDFNEDIEINNYELIMDPDEDPEIAAQIDSQLKNNSLIEDFEKPVPPFLGPLPENLGYTLALDLDETLIHYSEMKEAYYVRPGVTEFLKELSEYYQLVLFTASVRKYADWIVDQIDPNGYISHRLYRRHTVFKDAMYIKDLTMLGRDLK
jgi:hypothetical protein